MVGDIGLEPLQVTNRRFRRRVASVEKRVHRDRQFGVSEDRGERGDLPLV